MIRGWAEICVFTGLAAAVHAAVIVSVAVPDGLPEGAGASGDAVLSLAAVSPELAATVQGWTRPPEVMTQVVARAPEPLAELAPPVSIEETLPQPVPPVAGSIAAPDLPDMAISTPDAPALIDPAPAVASAPASTLSPSSSLRPTPRPATRPTPQPEPQPSITAKAPPPIAPAEIPSQTPQAEPPRTAQQAMGKGSAASRGENMAAVESVAARAAPSASSIAAWGATIRARIEARKGVPAGRWAPGRAVLRITVGRDGRLRSATILQSAGDARLDRAALAAVSRAGRLPKAPAGFDRDAMQFDLPISFTR